MSWRTSVYLLVFFFVKCWTWYPWWFDLIFPQFVLFVYYILQIAWWCYLLGKFSPRLTVPLSVCMTFERFIISLKICSNAFSIAIPCLDLSGSNYTHLDKISITTIINLNPSLCFQSVFKSTKSPCHCSSMWSTTTGFILKLRRIGSCKVYANCDFNHSSAAYINIFESCFFSFWSSLSFST